MTFDSLKTVLFKDMPEGDSTHQKLQNWKKMHDPESIGILFRFPPAYLSILIKSPCPIPLSASQNLNKEMSSTSSKIKASTIATIRAAKKLRKAIRHKESVT